MLVVPPVYRYIPYHTIPYHALQKYAPPSFSHKEIYVQVCYDVLLSNSLQCLSDTVLWGYVFTINLEKNLMQSVILYERLYRLPELN
jgi:hypothetical protein